MMCLENIIQILKYHEEEVDIQCEMLEYDFYLTNKFTDKVNVIFSYLEVKHIDPLIEQIIGLINTINSIESLTPKEKVTEITKELNYLLSRYKKLANGRTTGFQVIINYLEEIIKEINNQKI